MLVEVAVVGRCCAWVGVRYPFNVSSCGSQALELCLFGALALYEGNDADEVRRMTFSYCCAFCLLDCMIVLLELASRHGLFVVYHCIVRPFAVRSSSRGSTSHIFLSCLVTPPPTSEPPSHSCWRPIHVIAFSEGRVSTRPGGQVRSYDWSVIMRAYTVPEFNRPCMMGSVPTSAARHVYT